MARVTYYMNFKIVNQRANPSVSHIAGPTNVVVALIQNKCVWDIVTVSCW